MNLKLSLRRAAFFAAIAAASAFAAMADSIESLPVAASPLPGGESMHYYVVQPKETVYSLASRFGITIDELYANNPDAREGLKAYQTLWFPIRQQEREPQTITHEVEKGETVYGLSKQYGITVDELIAQNPAAADGLRIGSIITITNPAAHPATPAPKPAEPAPAPAPAPAEPAPAEPAPTPAPAEPAPVETAPAPANHSPFSAIPSPSPEPAPEPAPAVAEPQREAVIAVMLPLMLSEKQPSKSAARFTEFFKGLLLAADTLRRDGSPVRIIALDTEGSATTVKRLMQRPEVAGADVIIAPDDEAQLKYIASNAGDNTLVMNCFIVRDSLQKTNPRVVQTYTPSLRMQQKAVEGIIGAVTAPGSTKLVVLTRNGGPVDQASFVDRLRAEAAAHAIAVEEIAYTDRLRESDLSALTGIDNIIFVAPSADQPEANRILPAIADFSAANPMITITTLGHPKWVTFLGTTLENMHKTNTLVYNRFFADPEAYDLKRFTEAWTRNYGPQMDKSVPQPGPMGFDTGMLLIKGLRNGSLAGPQHVEATSYGVQNGFLPARYGAGWVNDNVYLINYRPSGVTDKTTL